MTMVLDGSLLYRMLANGCSNLKQNMQRIDDLNVFPIPDGDTGKNMTMTMLGGVNGSGDAVSSVAEIMAQFAKGALFSARGNSGVILSQYLRGLAEGMAGKETLTAAEFLDALEQGVGKAYSAVVHPVEGTMLTVCREGWEQTKAALPADASMETCLQVLCQKMQQSLEHTPELLSVLKESGVVDSGGAGVLCIFEGMALALEGTLLDGGAELPAAQPASEKSVLLPMEETPLTYGYCTEFILQLQQRKMALADFDRDAMVRQLEAMGDSLVCIQDGALVKVHVHTFAPEQVLAYARTMGEFLTVKIENMDVQHNELYREAPEQPKDPVAVVSTAVGEGIISFFRGMGVSAVVNGGQTNNPSVEDFLRAFRSLHAEHILVLPNDSNIIMTAEQAAALYEDAQIHVLPTKSIAEGYSALSMLDLSLDNVEDILTEMTRYLPNVTTGYVTTATRAAVLNGKTMQAGDFLGLTDDEILSVAQDPVTAARELLLALPEMEEKEVITVFCGADVTEAMQSDLRCTLEDAFPFHDIGLIDGGQSVYHFIFAIE